MSERAPRAVRSFVLRTGRMTPAQERALAELLPERRIEQVPARAEQRGAWPYRRPLHLEIGSGNGENALALAAARPDIEVLAAEVHPPGIGHTLLECERRGLTNLRVHDGDVVELLASLPPGALDAVYIYFPDPWPKKRHHKRRLVQAPLLDLLMTRCQPHARVNFASDDADYALAVRALIDSTPGWLNLAGPSAWAPRPRQRIVTRFELRARRAGRGVHDLAFTPIPG
jgi:tRNA (guanine-N7-)-methyltransferase